MERLSEKLHISSIFYTNLINFEKKLWPSVIIHLVSVGKDSFEKKICISWLKKEQVSPYTSRNGT